MKKWLLTLGFALLALFWLIDASHAATFSGDSVITSSDADAWTDTVVSWVTMFVTTVATLAVFLITKMFGNRIIGFVARVFSR